MLFAWAIDTAPVHVWDVTSGKPMPANLKMALTNPDVLIYAHNSHFDRTVLNHAMPGVAAGGVERWRDTMVRALAHGLPGSLGDLCDILSVSQDKAKDKAGKQLIQLFCKPRPKNSATRRAIATPGITISCRKLKLRRDGSWLRIQLPSGRAVCYPGARIDDSGKISYMGINTYSRKWQRLQTYGGKLAENVTQATARDVMAANMPCVEDNGYDIILTVHDEVLTEAPDTTDYSHEHLSTLLATNPAWALDLPLSAGGFEAYHYRKD
ncbi:hypothetical protein LU604_17985 [Erwinia tracheiphila]|nr:hypothetical protein [Erwinia tracheiphila]UIA85753.1 hypothetical protein LU604_17985 [Erwinia tracheiphila]UIA94279.1 hypothetical protein LU632_17530 [Erwinia tracheiphila]